MMFKHTFRKKKKMTQLPSHTPAWLVSPDAAAFLEREVARKVAAERAFLRVAEVEYAGLRQELRAAQKEAAAARNAAAHLLGPLPLQHSDWTAYERALAECATDLYAKELEQYAIIDRLRAQKKAAEERMTQRRQAIAAAQTKPAEYQRLVERLRALDAERIRLFGGDLSPGDMGPAGIDTRLQTWRASYLQGHLGPTPHECESPDYRWIGRLQPPPVYLRGIQCLEAIKEARDFLSHIAAPTTTSC